MRVVARPVPPRPRYALPEIAPRTKRRLVYGLVALCLLVVILPGFHLAVSGSGQQAAAIPGPRSWLHGSTLLTVYGRGFGIAPVLGRLGDDRNLNDVGAQTAEFRAQITQSTGRPPRLAIHLIYGLATPCAAAPRCLLYLDDTGVDLVRQYIEPAARRGWLVILDDQLGRSTPAEEVHRLIRRGYLRYDNVEVAFDPEFRTVQGQAIPGVPTGSISAHALVRAEHRLSTYSARQHLGHRKLVLVHEWNTQIVTGRRRPPAQTPYVQTVYVMDGIGTPAEKARVYRSLFGTGRPHVLTGVKLFPVNPVVPSDPSDTPVLTPGQLFGHDPIEGTKGVPTYFQPVPRVIVLT